jgi:hypothetical protein
VKPTINDLQKAVEKAGGVLEDDGRGYHYRRLQAVAPEGMVWAGEGLACLVVYWYDNEDNSAILQDVVERMEYGLEEE